MFWILAVVSFVFWGVGYALPFHIGGLLNIFLLMAVMFVVLADTLRRIRAGQGR